VNELDELRAEIAIRYAIPETAAVFLTGETVEAIEESASKLAALIDTRRDQDLDDQQPDPLSDALWHGPALKQARQRALVRILHGPPMPPRDERGRFASTRSGGGRQTAGFDGGARQPLLPQPSLTPEQAHDRIVVGLTALGRLGRSQF
jgi:hypothetical protein